MGVPAQDIVLPERVEGPDGLVLRRWILDDAEALGRRRAMIEEWEREWRQAGDAFLGIFLDGRVAGVPRKLGFEWLGEFEDEPAAPADLGIEWRWRMDGARRRRVARAGGATPGARS